MKRIYIFFLLICNSLQSFSQFAISYTPLVTYTKIQIDSIYTANTIPTFLLPIRYGVTVYKVLYNTVSFDSSATFASGALVLPDGPLCKLPIVSYQHGTILKKEDAPSRNTGEIIIGITLAADGYAVSMTDYIGLGDSPVSLHPYVHSQSEATASIDMLRASKEIITDSLGLLLNDQLFLAGYSQGGHATMAMQKIIEEQLTNEFTITQSDPMSGPYDLSNTQANVITNDSVFSQPAFLPFVMFAYDEVYNLFANPSDVFISPYDTLLPPLFDGLHTTGEVNAVMPIIPNDVLQPVVLDSFRNDPNHYFRLALQQNDLIDWVPQAPTKMYYCEADDQVYYQNAIVALNSFISNGALQVSAQSAGLTLDHGECARVTLILGKFDFEALRNDLIKTTFTVVDETSVGSDDGNISVTVTGGVQPYSFLWSNGATTQNIFNLSTGMYYLTITDNNQCVRYDSLFVDVLNSIILTLQPGSSIKIVPNPFYYKTNILFSNISFKEGVIEIFDSRGILLRKEQLLKVDSWMMNRNELQAGMYFLKFTFDGTISALNKIMIE